MNYSEPKVVAEIRDIEILVRIKSETSIDSRAKARLDIVSSIVSNSFKSKTEKIQRPKTNFIFSKKCYKK